MKTIETGLFLDDFEAEAKTHIEMIEAAFLSADSLADDPKLMNSVFRTAHSLKGTAGFFSLHKIVAVAHELESVFSQIRDGNLKISDEIVDVVLQCVDCLKDLTDNMQDDEGIDTEAIINSLKEFANTPKPAIEEDIRIPFDLKDAETEKTLKKSVRHGHKTYYINIGFNRSLVKYYEHPERLIDSINSVGVIVGALVNGRDIADNNGISIRGRDAGFAAGCIVDTLAKQDTSTLELLVTSVLEFDLFSIAIEINKKYIHHLDNETVFRSHGSSDAALTKKPADESSIAGAKATASADDGVNTRDNADDGAIAGARHGTNVGANTGVSTSVDANAGVNVTSGDSAGKIAVGHDSSFFIRLDITVINSLLDLANEMILTRNQLVSTMANHKKEIAGIAPVMYDMSRLTSEIQEKVMLTRMQPISVIFSKFPRIIRDTAKLLGKNITVEIIRDNVTLDKYLLEALTDPITQLVKNSADHGIESAEIRAAAGKPQEGKITLNSFIRDGSAIIEVTDDGGGIDKDALKSKALERGITTAEQLSSMPDKELYKIMFEPGYSTAKQLTNLSGRGVGMDIVKTNIEKLGGSIEIESEIGKGSTMRLKMPLTLSVTRTLIVTIDSVLYAVPELNVERIIRISGDSASKRIEKINKSLILSLNGRIIPIVTMGEIISKVKGTKPVSAYATLEAKRRDGIVKCLVLRANEKNFALLIDDALETEQILVKPLPVFLKNCPCYSNVTVLGNSKAVPILNAEGIMRYMNVESIETDAVAQLSRKRGAKEPEKEYEENEKQIIVFVCSGPEYFAVETKDISRIETVDPKNIQVIGKDRFINTAGKTVQVIRPEDFAPVNKQDYTGEKLYMLTLKNSGSPIGLLIRKVIDKVEDTFPLSDAQLCSEFIFGTSALNEKILIFLNPAAITKKTENEKVCCDTHNDLLSE